MRKALLLVVLACLHAAVLGQVRAPDARPAESVWLTVAGNANDPAVNTIQVDPAPVEVKDEFRTMRVRVSRSAERTSWDGVLYRSYESLVLFDCTHQNARYLSITFYPQPGWRGEAHKASIYPHEMQRWMEFRDVQPNPTARIVRAACLGISR